MILAMYHPCGCLSAAVVDDKRLPDKERGAFYRNAQERGCEIRRVEQVGPNWRCGKPESECQFGKLSQ